MKVKDENFYKLKNMVALFNNFTDEELISVLKLSTLKSYPLNKRIFREKETGESFFIIVKGSVNITKQIAPEFEEYLMTLKTGSYFGEMSIVDNMPRSANAVAAEDDTTLMEFNRNVMSQNLSVAYKFFKNFSRVLSERLRQTNEKLLIISTERNNLQARFKFFIKSKMEKEGVMNNANFKGADLTGVFLNKVTMGHSVMTGANLENARIKGSSLNSSSFCGGEFRGVVFEQCDFTQSNFTNTMFEKSVFKNCKFDDDYVKEVISK